MLFRSHITPLPRLEFNVVACHISSGANGEENEIVVVFNPNAAETVVTLPEGEWSIYVNGEAAGTEVLGTASETVTVAGVSAMALVKAAKNNDSMSIGIIGGADGPTAIFVSGGLSTILLAAGAVCLTAAIVIFLKKRKK